MNLIDTLCCAQSWQQCEIMLNGDFFLISMHACMGVFHKFYIENILVMNGALW
jgi:hypothetical protein